MANTRDAVSRLFIGGSSCTGKTTVARALAQRLGWQAIHLDRALPSEPALDPLAGPPELWDRAPAELCALLIGAAEAATPHVLQLATAASSGNSIFEGERLHPALLAKLARDRETRAALVIEIDAERLHATLSARSPRFGQLSERRRRAVVEVDRLYGLWLMSEGARLGVACVPSQPWPTLPERLLDAARWPTGRFASSSSG